MVLRSIRGRCVHSGIGCTLVVVGYIRGFSVYSGALWGSFGFITVHPGGREIHFESLGSFWFPLGVVVFIPVRWVHWVAS